jgi:hypothetical protein
MEDGLMMINVDLSENGLFSGHYHVSPGNYDKLSLFRYPIFRSPCECKTRHLWEYNGDMDG